MQRNDYKQMLVIIKRTGNLILKARVDEGDIGKKEGFSNFVTRYDKEVQHVLIEEFQRIIPDARFLAEEDHIQQGLGNGYCFIIDPIDGTTNFIFDYRHSCIAVGLAYAGEMIFGAVYDPYEDEMFSAVKGNGAFLNGRKIRATEKGLAENLTAFGCARYNSDDTDRAFSGAKKLYLHSLGIREGGSGALDICRTACGRSGLYFELLLQPWDYAAASLILQEAGGVITQIDGTPITLDRPCSILAGGKVCMEEAGKLGL
jgi:myo-inositol-1(or 4)-monophosphatase